MANVITLDVYQVGNFPVQQGISTSISIDFPASLIFAQETNITVSGVQMNAFIVFNGQQYYVAETVAQIETAANAGGSGGHTIYTGDGSLQGDRTVDLNAHNLVFLGNGDLLPNNGLVRIDGAANLFQVSSPSFKNGILQAVDTVVYAGDVDGSTVLWKIDISQDEIYNIATHNNFTLHDYANNAAAITGGLEVGDLYYTNTAGEATVKIVI